MQRDARLHVPAGAAGRPLADFLAARFTYHTAAEWIGQVAAGRIAVNGRPAQPDAILAAGDTIAYDTSGLPEPPVDPAFRIVLDDAALLVINKSGNLPCHPAGRYFNHTLWALLKTHHAVETPIFVNRLDRETSGLVVVARTPSAARACRTQFASRDVRKRYVALVEGAFPPTALTTRGWLMAEGGAVRKRRLFTPDPGAANRPPAGEWAETGLRLIAQHGPVAEIEAEPVTGRLHQIRATLHALGFPVVGDKLYGADPGWFVRFCRGELDAADRLRLRLDRQALHAAGLQFRHPISGCPLVFDLPLPADMLALVSGRHPGVRESAI